MAGRGNGADQHRLATPEVEYILQESGARVLFVDGATAAHAEVLEHRLPAIEAVFYLDDDAPPADTRPYEALAAAPAVADVGAGGDTMAALFYTGGTTGKSKGVMLSHNNLVWNAMNMIVGVHYDQDMTYLHSAPMFHLADGSRPSVSQPAAGATSSCRASIRSTACRPWSRRRSRTVRMCQP